MRGSRRRRRLRPDRQRRQARTRCGGFRCRYGAAPSRDHARPAAWPAPPTDRPATGCARRAPRGRRSRACNRRAIGAQPVGPARVPGAAVGADAVFAARLDAIGKAVGGAARLSVGHPDFPPVAFPALVLAQAGASRKKHREPERTDPCKTHPVHPSRFFRTASADARRRQAPSRGGSITSASVTIRSSGWSVGSSGSSAASCAAKAKPTASVGRAARSRSSVRS